LSGLWAFDRAWHTDEASLRCARILGTCKHNPSIVAVIVSEISAFIRTDGQTDMVSFCEIIIADLTDTFYSTIIKR